MAIWKWFQSAYDRIDSWDMSPSMKFVCKQISAKIPDVVAKALLTYIKGQYDKSEDIAMATFKSIKEKLNEIV